MFKTVLLPLCYLLFLPLAAFSETTRFVPALAALTGDAASFGSGERDAYLLAIEEWNAKGGINGEILALQIEDTTSTAVGTISAFKKLNSLEGQRVILGPTWGDTFQAVIPVAARSDALLLTPSAEGNAIDAKVNHGPFMITTYPSTEKEIGVLLDAAKARGTKRAGIISQQEPYAIFVREVLVTGAGTRGLELHFDESVSGTTTDFRSLLATAKRKGVDSLFILLYTDSSFSQAIRQRKELFPESKLYGTHDLVGYAERAEFVEYLEGAVSPQFTIRDQRFVEKFRSRFDSDPNLTASYASDAVNILLSAWAKGKNSVREIREYILSSEHDTVSYGKVRFLPEGRLKEAEVGLVTIKGGKIVRERIPPQSFPQLDAPE